MSVRREIPSRCAARPWLPWALASASTMRSRLVCAAWEPGGASGLSDRDARRRVSDSPSVRLLSRSRVDGGTQRRPASSCSPSAVTRRSWRAKRRVRRRASTPGRSPASRRCTGRNCLWGEAADRPSARLAHRLGEELDQGGDVVAPLAQRRDVHHDAGEPIKEVRAKLTALTALAQVAIRRRHDRTATFFALTAPTGKTSPASRTRRSFACNARESSPTSSRKSVPRSAASTSPVLARSAPVNAPLSCPNSSLSASVSGSAAQLSRTKGPFWRGD